MSNRFHHQPYVYGTFYRSSPKWIRLALVLFVVLALTDETARKFIGSSGIYVTFAKDLVLFTIAYALLRKTRLTQTNWFLLFAMIIYTSTSALVIYFQYGSNVHLFASIKVYLVFSAGIIIGLCMRRYDELCSSFFSTLILGMILVSILATIQEYARGLLPMPLRINNFIESHSGAVGLYVEGTFGSPQTLSVYAFVAFVVLFSKLHNLQLPKWSLVAVAILFIHTVYIARVRFTLVFLAILAVVYATVWLRRPTIRRWVGLYLIMMPIVAIIAIPMVTERFETNFVTSSFEWAAISDRVEAAFALKLEGADLIVGKGNGTTGRLAQLLQSENMNTVFSFDSGYSQLLTQFGLVGMLPICLLLFSAFLMSVRTVFVAIIGKSILSGLLPIVICGILLLTLLFFKQYSLLVNGATGALIGIFVGMIIGEQNTRMTRPAALQFRA